MRRSLGDFEEDVSIGDRKISNPRYADDITLIAASESKHEEMRERVTNERRALGLENNLAKTKLMVVDRNNSLPTENRLPNIQRVEKFVYLG